MKKKKGKRSTRISILEAAGQLFAEKGFKGATIRDICHKADVNIAAVNYHFGDKDGLYDSLIEYIFEEMRDKFPIQRAEDDTLEPKDRLYAFIEVLLYRRHSPDLRRWHGILFERERMQPKAAVRAMHEREISRMKKVLNSIIKGFVGDKIDDDTADLLRESVISQIVFQGLIREKAAPPFLKKKPMDAATIQKTARHITDFSVAALERYNQSSSQKRKPK